MAVPIRHKDILKNYVDNASNAAWARDLVSLAVKTGGVMTDAEHMMVLTEFENGTMFQLSHCHRIMWMMTRNLSC